MKTLRIDIPDKTHAKIKTFAAKQGQTVKQTVLNALKDSRII